MAVTPSILIQCKLAKSLCTPLTGEPLGNTTVNPGALPAVASKGVPRPRNTFIQRPSSYDVLKNVAPSKAVIPAAAATQKLVIHEVVVPEKSPTSVAQVDTAVLPPRYGELKLEGSTKSGSTDHQISLGTTIPGYRTSPLSIRLSEYQKKIIKGKARTAGVPVNRYILHVVLGADYKPPMSTELRQALLMLNRELTAQGRNINQIAKQVNSGIVTPIHGISMLDGIRIPLLRTLEAVRKALTHGLPGMAP